MKHLRKEMEANLSAPIRKGPIWRRFINWFSHTWIGLKLWPAYIVTLPDGKSRRIMRIKSATEIETEDITTTSKLR